MAVDLQSKNATRVAIVGGASSRRYAPYDDPAWDIWAFSSLRLVTPRFTRWFEMHATGDLRSQLKFETRYRRSFRTYTRFLAGLSCPVYMQREFAHIPNSVRYPLRAALKAFGRCFSSTASYMIALAIMEEYETIGLWGISLTARQTYLRQRPAIEYLLGVARQRGIEVRLPPGSTLRIPARPRVPLTRVLYGYDWKSPGAWWRRKARASAGR